MEIAEPLPTISAVSTKMLPPEKGSTDTSIVRMSSTIAVVNILSVQENIKEEKKSLIDSVTAYNDEKQVKEGFENTEKTNSVPFDMLDDTPFIKISKFTDTPKLNCTPEPIWDCTSSGIEVDYDPDHYSDFKEIQDKRASCLNSTSNGTLCTEDSEMEIKSKEFVMNNEMGSGNKPPIEDGFLSIGNRLSRQDLCEIKEEILESSSSESNKAFDPINEEPKNMIRNQVINEKEGKQFSSSLDGTGIVQKKHKLNAKKPRPSKCEGDALNEMNTEIRIPDSLHSCKTKLPKNNKSWKDIDVRTSDMYLYEEGGNRRRDSRNGDKVHTANCKKRRFGNSLKIVFLVLSLLHGASTECALMNTQLHLDHEIPGSILSIHTCYNDEQCLKKNFRWDKNQNTIFLGPIDQWQAMSKYYITPDNKSHCFKIEIRNITKDDWDATYQFNLKFMKFNVLPAKQLVAVGNPDIVCNISDRIPMITSLIKPPGNWELLRPSVKIHLKKQGHSSILDGSVVIRDQHLSVNINETFASCNVSIVSLFDEHQFIVLQMFIPEEALTKCASKPPEETNHSMTIIVGTIIGIIIVVTTGIIIWKKKLFCCKKKTDDEYRVVETNSNNREGRTEEIIGATNV